MHMCLLGATISGAEALCTASSVVPDRNGLPTAETMTCVKDPSNKNVRKAYKDKFCKPDSTYGYFTTTYPILHDIMNASGPIKSDNALLEKIARAFLDQPDYAMFGSYYNMYPGLHRFFYADFLGLIYKALKGSTKIGYEDMKKYLGSEAGGVDWTRRGDEAQDLIRVREVKFLIESAKAQGTEPYKSLYDIASSPRDLYESIYILGLVCKDELLRKLDKVMNRTALAMTSEQLVDAMRNGVLNGLETKADIIQRLLQEYFGPSSLSKQFSDMIRVCESIE